jgi:hypothetical protein
MRPQQPTEGAKMNRPLLVSIVSLSTAVFAGCVTTADPQTRAEAQCMYLAQGEGLRLQQFDGVQSNANGVIALNVRIEDALGRRLRTVCNYAIASNSASWAQPLPAGLRRS